MPFTLSHRTAKLANLNVRAEQAGADKLPASDLKFSINVPSDSLIEFAPELRGLLYWKNGGGGDLADQTHDAPNLRFPRLGPLSWEGEIVGAELTVHYGLGGKSDLVVAAAKVNRFVIDPQEGGTVIIQFRVQAHPDEKSVGKLYSMIQRDVDISLTGPDFSEERDEDGGGEE